MMINGRRFISKSFIYGSCTYVVQTDLAAGLSRRYTVYRLDSYEKHCRIIAREVTYREAMKMFPKES